MSIFGYTFSVEFSIFFCVMLISFIIQLLYYKLYFRIVKHKNSDYITDKFPVSIIICARNEAISLRKNLPAILEQEYSDFEVVVVNDCSEDDTDMVIAELREEYKHLRSTTINKDKKFTHGKKLALTVGIKSAKYDWLVLTDADCKPSSNKWLYNIQHNFNKNAEVVIGFGGYRRRKGLLDKFVRFDTLFIAMQYLSMAIKGKPYMGVGRNLAYRKELFFKNKGFSSHAKILSGDDDLFINQVATKENTRVELNAESFIVSEPPMRWGEWFRQKKRHLTTYPYYKKDSKISLGLELFTRLSFYASFIWLMVLNQEILLVLPMFGLRFVFQLIVFKSVMNRLNQKYLLLFSPIMDILFPFINFIVIVSNNLGSKNNRW